MPPLRLHDLGGLEDFESAANILIKQAMLKIEDLHDTHESKKRHHGDALYQFEVQGSILPQVASGDIETKCHRSHYEDKVVESGTGYIVIET